MTSPSDSSRGRLEAAGNVKITAVLRERRNGHRGLVVWLTGLSGAGKTTIATELERQLFHAGRHTYLLDGDILRHGLCRDLGFSAEARGENIRRAGEVAALMADAGCIVIAAFISPFRADRERVRGILAKGRFIEVFVNAPLEVCERRDVKGLYAKARAGSISEFTGISAPYEAPLHPEVEVRTDQVSAGAAVEKILAVLGGPVSGVNSRRLTPISAAVKLESNMATN